HGAGGRESLRELRGLGRYFAFSRWGFLVGALALIGTPIVTAGSYSKDAIIEAALAVQPLLGWLLVGGVVLTGLYIGRLFSIVYAAAAADPRRTHHDVEAERFMNWSLVPLAIGSISFGWLGGGLAGRLGDPLGEIEHAAGPLALSMPGLLAFVLGALGFVAAWWYATRRPEPAAAPATADTSYRAAPWVRAIADAGYSVAGTLARVHSGLLPRYAFASVVALAAILMVRLAIR
ncbi:MAG: hypothetical protein M3336_01065, partial [Chloroflexota bacterium]|nr:hypothetical protein [Chloroflexota bacterium]